MTITFINGEYLYLLLLLIPYSLWYFLYRKKRETTIAVSDTNAYRYLKRSFRLHFIHLPFILRLITITALIISLARPQGNNVWKNAQVEGIDIMMALDISTSMLAEDLKPNRIEAAKSVATEFISGRENDNIGLTVFAAEAFTQCPMTVEHKSLLSLLQGLSCDMPLRGLISDGTAIGMGIMNAVSRLEKSKAKSKIVILLTDGSNNKGDISPLTAAEVAKTYGIRIYTIGVGTNRSAPYPYPLPGGGVHYMNMPVEIDQEVLQNIAQITGGQFYRATSNQKLKQIYRDIDTLERTKFSVKTYSKHDELYPFFMWVAFFSLCVELLLGMTWLKRIP